jgi:small subunit ribosomal protein S1
MSEKDTNKSDFAKLISDSKYFKLPKVGEVIKGKVINASKSEVRLDIDGVKTGVIRGRELYNESEEYGHLKPEEIVEATVVELENENGELELSFRFAGQQKAWNYLRELMNKGEVIPIKITDANKGGLMVKIGHIAGFLPVSQLIPEHYPRVEGGDKNKILEFLKKFVGQPLQVKVIDADEKDEKLIVSEKAAWAEAQEKAVSQYKVGDKIKGRITAVTDFGAFVEFGNKMEGLVHISEIAWQRIDDPREFVKVGDDVEAEIIKIEGTKIFLSIKKLKDDPWKDIAKKYKVGEMVSGKVLKVNPFGLFVELDSDIHGLAHISELSDKPVNDVNEIAKAGETIKFRVISVEPENHRLGLSLKSPKEKTKEEKTEIKEKKESASALTSAKTSKATTDKEKKEEAEPKKEKPAKKETNKKVAVKK